MFVLILIYGLGIRESGVVVPGQYDWRSCQRAGQVAISREHQQRKATGFTCVPAPTSH